MSRTRSHDIIVFGATSFVGQIVCRYLSEREGDGAVDWAMAGRSAEKLASVADEVGADVDRIVADAHDPEAMAELCAGSKLVMSTVGPYALHGSTLVGAAVDAGIDYCDISGEPQWMRRMIDEHHDLAVDSGARVVHSCGFDSVPSDMGVWFVQREAQAAFGEPCTSIRMGVKAMKGGPSGGTLASAFNVMEEIAADPALRKVIGSPYALAKEGDRSGPRQPSVTLPEYDDGLASWMAPFVMAATNTRIVFRTHSLLGRPWGDGFTYGEATMTGDGIAGRAKAGAIAGATAGILGAASLTPLRSVMSRLVPQPGDGPSPEQQEAGFFNLRFHGTTAGGDEMMVKVTGDRDPGYGSTAKMLAEAAITLLGTDRDEVGGGFWTPATALGDDYITALQANAGITFEVL